MLRLAGRQASQAGLLLYVRLQRGVLIALALPAGAARQRNYSRHIRYEFTYVQVTQQSHGHSRDLGGKCECDYHDPQTGLIFRSIIYINLEGPN